MSPAPPPKHNRPPQPWGFWPILVVLLLAFALRTANLANLPPGWRDDEIIETTIHAQRILDGDRPLFFVEAEGHEPLYHYLTAGWIALMGPRLFWVRLVSVAFGLLAIAAAYRLSGQLFDRRLALWVALFLAVAFWALMYSRTKIRHISSLVFVLLALSFLWQAYVRPNWRNRLLTGLFTGLALYTYFAALALPPIIFAFGLYLLLARRATFIDVTRIALIPLLIAGVLYAPLFLAMRATGGSAERLAIVGAPLLALLDANPLPVLQTTAGTLLMFVATGDPEALYNLPGRPVFDLLTFTLFSLAGLLPLAHAALLKRDPRAALIGLWWLGGLAPAFVSLPAASLGHAILAQPATYLILAVAVANLINGIQPQFYTNAFLSRFSLQSLNRLQRLTSPNLDSVAALPRRLHWLTHRLLPAAVFALVFTLVAARDLHSYFVAWPQNDLVRLLYRADLHRALQTHPPTGPSLVASGLSLWDIRAFLLEPNGATAEARWVNPDAAWVFFGDAEPTLWLPDPTQIPELSTRTFYPAPSASIEHAPFENGWVLLGWSNLDANNRDIILHWLVSDHYTPPRLTIGTSPEAPGQPYRIFLHLFDLDGNFIAGVDRLELDAYTLRPGDLFVQLHPFTEIDAGWYNLVAGIYDPDTGVRLRTVDGRDSVDLGQVEFWPR